MAILLAMIIFGVAFIHFSDNLESEVQVDYARMLAPTEDFLLLKDGYDIDVV